jgi:hypothetical protein
MPLALPLASRDDSAAFVARIPRTSRSPSSRRATNTFLFQPSALAFLAFRYGLAESVAQMSRIAFSSP